MSTRSRRPLIAMVSNRARYAGGEAERSDQLLRAAGAAAGAGVDFIQVRERDLPDRALLSLVRRIMVATSGTPAKVIVNDRCDVALAAGAGGVHLPARSVRSRRVRGIVPPGFLIGRSVHSEAEALAEESDGACDYLVFGTVYSTASKPPEHPISGIDALARVCRRVGLPILAIGGITLEQVPAIAQAGAAGIAAIGLFQRGDSGSSDDFGRIVREIHVGYGVHLSNIP